MAGASGKDMTVFEFRVDETAEMARNALLRERCQKNPRREEIRVTKEDFINCFSRKRSVDRLEASDELNSEHDSGIHQGETTGQDEEEHMDSLTNYNVGHYLNGASVNAALNNDDSKAMTSTTSDPSEDEHVDLTSEDEGLSTRKFSISNAMSDVSDDEGASEHSDSESCHNSDDADNMESEDSGIVLCPEFSLFGSVTILMSRFTFTAEFIRLEIYDHKTSSDAFNVFQWNICDMDYVKTYWLSGVCVAVLILGFKHGSTTELENLFGVPGAQSVLEFALNEPSWLEQEQQIISLSDAYNDIWKSLDGDTHRFEDIVCELYPETFPAFQDQYLLRFEQTFDEFVFPKGDPDAVTISGRDILLLQPETFINDTLIDFYIKYLQSTLSDKQRKACHFFNSFFFRKLADLDKAPDTDVVNRNAFLRVRKWTRRVNFFEKDYIFIPINYGLHWSLIVICNPGAVLSLEDGNHSETPCILHMDSISGTHANLRKLIQSYLWEEWRERHMENEEMFDAARENFVNMPFISLEVPQQHNYCDCGLFLLHYVEMFLREAPPKFSISEVQKIPNFLTSDWFLPREASTLKRTYIRDLIYKLHKEVSLNGPAPSNGASHQSYEAGQSDVGTSQDIECISEDHASKQLHAENMFLLDKLNQISVCHMDEDTPGILLCETSKGVAMEDFGKSLGLVCGEHDGIETDSHICHDEQYGSFHQNTLAELLKSSLSQKLETDNQSTHQLLCASGINNSSSDVLYQYRTDDPGHTEKESEDLCVPPAVTSSIQLGLLSVPPDLDSSQLLGQEEEHSERSSKRVCCTEGLGSPSTASESSYRVRKLEIFDTWERKKQKSLDGVVDLEADEKASVEIEERATVMDLKNACETNVCVEPESDADILQPNTQVACEDDTQVERLNTVCKDLESNVFPKQSLQQEKAGNAELVSSDHDNNIPLGEQNMKSSAQKILNFQDAVTSSHCETVTGDLDGSENFTRDSSVPCQADLQSVDHDNEAGFASGDELKPFSSTEDHGRSDGNTVKNGAIVVDGGECVDSSAKTNGNSNNFADSSGKISQDADKLVPLEDEHVVDYSKCTNSIDNTNEILDNAVVAEGMMESFPGPVDNTSITPEKQKILASEDTVEVLSSTDFSSPPPELIMRRTRNRKTPSTIGNEGNVKGDKGARRILERPRTRSVTKNMDFVELSRESRRKSISKK